MADISQYLDLIDKAVKGEEVRDSIHDAIEAINLENEKLNSTIRRTVQSIVDTSIENSSAIEQRIETYLDEDVFYILFEYDESTQTVTVNHSDLEVSDWIEASSERDYYKIPAFCYIHGGSISNYIKLDVINGIWSATYFYYTSSHDIYLNYICLGIFGEEGMIITSEHNKIYPQSGGSGGGDSEVFIMQFTVDRDKDVTCNRSSTEAEDFMDNKYGAGNWSWNDFWKEAVITLYNEYEAWDYEAGAIASSTEVVMTLSHIDLVRGYLYFSTDYIDTRHLEVDDHHTYVSFEWDLDGWTTLDHASNVDFKIYGGLEAGTGINFSMNEHLPGTGIVTNVISIDLDNGDTEEY